MAEEEEAAATKAAAQPNMADYVPRKRHSKVLVENTTLTEANEGLQTRLDDALAISLGATRYKTDFEALTVEFEAFRGQAAQNVVLTRFGIDDDDGMHEARRQHGKLPEEGRPEFEAMLAGWKEKPETVPKTLASYFGATTDTTTTDTTTAGGLTRSTGTVTTTATGEPVSAQALVQARSDWQAGKITTEAFQAITNAGVAVHRARR